MDGAVSLLNALPERNVRSWRPSTFLFSSPVDTSNGAPVSDQSGNRFQILIAAGYPEKGFPKKLSRRPVEELAFLDSFDRPLQVPPA